MVEFLRDRGVFYYISKVFARHTLNIRKASLLYGLSHLPLSCLLVRMHLEDLNGFSPVWVLSCFILWSDFKKLLSHFEHLKGFSPV